MRGGVHDRGSFSRRQFTVVCVSDLPGFVVLNVCVKDLSLHGREPSVMIANCYRCPIYRVCLYCVSFPDIFTVDCTGVGESM